MSIRMMLLDFFVFIAAWAIFRSLVIGVPSHGEDFIAMVVGAVTAQLTMMWLRKRQARAAA
ncbi:hypothetical protein [Paludisphaera mucosa]|uniref:Uncharacterized protein n=1 Tax=Paludisphaera mucosa TaxID=3030827 RepID=A0ABT6FAI2_9BACT|nr:hypothetical protein [Paludisphaera mucosa]MDG3004390.1 hypothetical protein [Paludisphaera mucosa]